MSNVLRLDAERTRSIACSTAPGQANVEQLLAFGASRQEAGGAAVRAGVRAALERQVALTGGPGLLLLPPLAAGLVLAGLPLLQVPLLSPRLYSQWSLQLLVDDFRSGSPACSANHALGLA